MPSRSTSTVIVGGAPAVSMRHRLRPRVTRGASTLVRVRVRVGDRVRVWVRARVWVWVWVRD